MLWFVCFFNYADRMAIFSVFKLLKEEMDLTDKQLGIIGSAFMWVYAAMLPLAGIIADRLRRKTLILGGLIFWSFITLATALSQEYWHLVCFRALEGLGEAFYFPASMALISDYHSRATRSRALAIHQSSVYAGTIAGATVAGFLAESYGWRSGFYVFGSFGALLGIVLFGFLREPERGQAEEIIEERPPLPAAKRKSGSVLGDIASIFSTPMVLVLIATFAGANFVAAIFLTWMPTYLNRNFGMNLGMAGLNSTAWLQIASVLGVLTGGVLADRLARRHAGGRMVTQAFGLFCGVPFLFLTGWTLSTTVLVLAMVGFGYFKGMYDANIWASLFDVVNPRRRATAQGLMNSLGWFGGAFAPVAVGAAIAPYGLSACISATSVIYLTVGVLLTFGILMFMRGRRSAAQPAET